MARNKYDVDENRIPLNATGNYIEDEIIEVSKIYSQITFYHTIKPSKSKQDTAFYLDFATFQDEKMQNRRKNTPFFVFLAEF